MEDQKIIVTDTLKVEIFHMPVIDLSIRFCYRFVEPIPMIWQNDGRVSAVMGMSSQIQGRDFISEQMLQKFREIIEQSKRQGMWHESLTWLEDVNKVNLITCELTPKDEYNWQELVGSYNNAMRRG